MSLSDQSLRSDAAIAALLAMLAERSGCAAAGLLNPDGAPRLGHPTAFAVADLAGIGGTPTGIAPERIGLTSGFAAAIAVTTPDGGTAGYLILSDPRRRRRLGETVAAALTDGALILAGLLADPPARAALPRPAEEDAVLRWMATGLRAAEDHALLLVDIDRFRALNEVLGRRAGDVILRHIAARIDALLVHGERMLRLEGDRFAILTRRSGVDPRSLADRVLRAVAPPLDVEGRRIAVQASIGIVDRINAVTRPRALLAQASAAVRRAKAEGRNRYELHVPALDLRDLEQSRMEFDLAHALAGDQMHVAFQPYIELATGAVAGAEALLRWRHPTRGDMRPASFVSLAESTGLILPLGAWMLRRALEAASRWSGRLTLSVNISALQFHQPRFVAEVDAALAATGFPATRLELEITETVLMRDNPQTVAQMRELIARGIRIALDDFGTGYSALAYLARLPHHRIKLGRSFVQDLGNPATAGLIRAIVASARGQGVAITAEGAETLAELEAVRAMGFTHAQGFVIGPPVERPSDLFTAATESAF